MSALRCRPVALLMLVVFLAGCSAWRPTTVGPVQLIEEEQPSSVRITRGDGSQLTLNRPFVRNDSLGTVEDVCETSAAGGGRFNCVEMTRTVLPVTDVVGLEVRGTSSAAPIAVAIVLIPLVLVVGQELCVFDNDSDACN